MNWLYDLPDDKRREVLALQSERALAVQLALGMALDTKKPMGRDEARRIVARCNREIERIAETRT